MIELNNITKVYKSKKKNSHKAINEINLFLPDNGLVFIIGKSGSGKSTLLNLIGGLDSITSGNIIVDGNDITEFNENELANYRNNHIGFIFQDYHLLDELTVYENIRLSLNLVKREDDGQVAQALAKVGLSGYENRYPQELSGGERQRVAIARAIVKKPYIILADEPTGNLDNETGTQIVSLLKDLSKECLIIIVSHNTIDTYKYADRIIKLETGNVISDETRNPEYVDEILYSNDIMYYPFDKVLSNDDVSVLNEKLETQKIKKIEQRTNKYLATDTKAIEERYIKIQKKSLVIKDIFILSLTFLKSKLFRIVASSFMIAIIMVILALSQTIINFDAGKIIKTEMSDSNQNSLLLKKPNRENNPIVENEYFYEILDKSFIDEFITNNQSEEIYPMINYTVPIISHTGSIQFVKNYISKCAIHFTHGTLIVDNDFFVEKIGYFEFVEQLELHDERGVYITDYVADLILATSPLHKDNDETYKDLLGYYSHAAGAVKSSYINGIIKTDYKEKYKDLFERIESMELADYSKDLEYQSFLNEVYDYLGYSYSFNPNFIEDCINDPLVGYANSHWLMFNDIVSTFSSGRYAYRAKYLNWHINENEVSMSYQKYNKLFNTNYDSNNIDTFVPHEIKISQYKYYDYERENKLNEFTITISQLHDQEYCPAMFVCGENAFKAIHKNDLFCSGIYINNPDNLSSIMSFYEENGMEFQSFIISGVHTMTKAVDVFIPIFELVAIVLCIGIVFILISFSSKMIKDKMHDIGILKALGCKNMSIGTVFGLQLLLIALCTIVLSIVGYFFFIDLANDVLIESLKVLAPSHIVLDLEFLTFKINIAGINSLLVIVLTLISFVMPMMKIYKIKPVQIIKAKE